MPRVYDRSVRELIVEFLRDVEGPVRVKDIAEALDINYNTVRGRLQELKREGVVEVISRGQYVLRKRKHGRRKK